MRNYKVKCWVCAFRFKEELSYCPKCKSNIREDRIYRNDENLVTDEGPFEARIIVTNKNRFIIIKDCKRLPASLLEPVILYIARRKAKYENPLLDIPITEVERIAREKRKFSYRSKNKVWDVVKTKNNGVFHFSILSYRTIKELEKYGVLWEKSDFQQWHRSY